MQQYLCVIAAHDNAGDKITAERRGVFDKSRYINNMIIEKGIIKFRAPVFIQLDIFFLYGF